MLTPLQTQRGLTILETVIVLIIAGLIVSAVWVAFSRVNQNDRVARTLAVVDKTVQITRDYLLSKPNVPASLSVDLYNYGAMPTDLTFVAATATAATFNSPLGQSFAVGAYTGNAPTLNPYFEMDITFQPGSAQCTQLMPQILGNGRLIADRGVVGYAFGGLTSGQPSNGNTPAVPTTDNFSISGKKGCSTAGMATLYFAMRP